MKNVTVLCALVLGLAAAAPAAGQQPVVVRKTTVTTHTTTVAPVVPVVHVTRTTVVTHRKHRKHYRKHYKHYNTSTRVIKVETKPVLKVNH